MRHTKFSLSTDNSHQTLQDCCERSDCFLISSLDPVFRSTYQIWFAGTLAGRWHSALAQGMEASGVRFASYGKTFNLISICSSSATLTVARMPRQHQGKGLDLYTTAVTLDPGFFILLLVICHRPSPGRPKFPTEMPYSDDEQGSESLALLLPV